MAGSIGTHDMTAIESQDLLSNGMWGTGNNSLFDKSWMLIIGNNSIGRNSLFFHYGKQCTPRSVIAKHSERIRDPTKRMNVVYGISCTTESDLCIFVIHDEDRRFTG